MISKEIPRIPRIKALVNGLRNVNNPIPMFNKYLEEYGDSFYMELGGGPIGLFTIDRDIIQHVLQKNHKNYHKSPIQSEKLGMFLGKGLLTTNGAYWLKQRRLIQPGFHREKLANIVRIMNREIDKALDHYEQLAAQGNWFDMHHEMMELTFRVVAMSLFSTELKEEDLFALRETVEVLQAYVVRLVRQPYLTPFFKLFGTHKNRVQRVTDYNEIILKLINLRRESGEEQDDLLDMMLASRYEETNEGMTDEQLIAETSVLFAAGHETSANALTWMFYLLSKHPEVIEKIREEIKTTLGDQEPGFENLMLLGYTKNVIQEGMRLYPPAWVLDRIALEDDEVNGIKIPKGTYVFPYVYGVHHSATHWDDPEAFRPERFNEKPASYTYFPFGGGPRLCIGNNFALMEMQLVLSRLLKRYNPKFKTDHPIEMQPQVTLSSKFGMQMKLEKME